MRYNTNSAWREIYSSKHLYLKRKNISNNNSNSQHKKLENKNSKLNPRQVKERDNKN